MDAAGFTFPQEQVQLAAGAGDPQLEQNLPVFSAPQEHFHTFAGAGLGEPQLEQKFPLFLFPQEQVQPLAAVAAALC